MECETRGWVFDDKLTIKDLGVSAYLGKNFDRRFALGKFIEASKQGKLPTDSVLIVENPDRFSRDTLDNADNEFWSLVKRGVDILVLSNGLLLTKGDENDPAKRAILMFEFSRAHGESKRKSDIISAACKRKYKEAGEKKIINFGGYTPRWVTFVGEKGQTGKYILNEKAPIVRRIIKEYLTGNSTTSICKLLNKEGIKPFTSTKIWQPGMVYNIIDTNTLIGTVKIKGTEFKNHIPSVITQNQYNQIQVRLQLNQSRKGGNQSEVIANLFRNRCFCSKCGGNVCVHTSNRGKNRTFYRCRNARFGNGCTKKMMPVTPFEKQFFSWHFMFGVNEIIGSENKENQQAIDSLNGQKILVENKIKELTKLLGLGLPHLVTEFTNCKTELDSINDQIRQKELNTVKKLSIDVDHLRKLAKDLNNNETRKQLLNELPKIIDRIEFDLENRQYWFVESGVRGGPFKVL